MNRDELFQTLSDLVALHSPSGVEQAVDAYLLEHLKTHGEPTIDAAGNITLRIAGRDSSELVAILAHKDEIGAMVKRVDDDGRLAVAKVGGSFPWVWGEGPVEILGDNAQVTGILSFGARHISDESTHHAQGEKAVQWSDAWVETKLSDEELAAAGVRPDRGWCRAAIGRRRCASARAMSTSRRTRSTTRARWRACSTWPPG